MGDCEDVTLEMTIIRKRFLGSKSEEVMLEMTRWGEISKYTLSDKEAIKNTQDFACFCFMLYLFF